MIACEQGWTNTDEISNSSIKVYPNPTSSLLSIHLPKVEFETGSIISIFDFSGRLILTKKFNPSDIENSIISLNVKDVPQGMYSCVIQSENKIFSTKFTKI